MAPGVNCSNVHIFSDQKPNVGHFAKKYDTSFLLKNV